MLAGIYSRSHIKLSVLTAVKTFLVNWIFRPRGPESGTVRLTQRRVFIIPTRSGFLFGAVLLLMLTGSINYNLSLGYLLTFLLAALAIVSILHTFRNLAGLQLHAGKTLPVFAGDGARFAVRLENPGGLARCAIGLARAGQEQELYDIAARQGVDAVLRVPAKQRGLLRPGRFTLFTRFPLGLFYAWSSLELDTHCLIYPHPAAEKIPLPAPQPQEENGGGAGRGGDDFAGLRPYHAGDSPRHVVWKAAARSQGLLVKQFGGQAQTELWLDWNSLPATLATEAGLSLLARWVLDAHAAGLCFGLRLPGKSISPASGDLQREKCLEALALYEAPHPL